MTNSNEQTLYEQEAGTHTGRQGLAAAAAARQLTSLMERAERASGISRSELARRLEVTGGRVTQVLNGDGNVHIATAARFLAAMGYQLNLTAVDDEGLPVSAPTTRTRACPPGARAMFASVYTHSWANRGGVTQTTSVVEHADLADRPQLLATTWHHMSANAALTVWHSRDAATYAESSVEAIAGEVSVARQHCDA
jgi:hypothetical protein